jgi:hypothetical protein
MITAKFNDNDIYLKFEHLSDSSIPPLIFHASRMHGDAFMYIYMGHTSWCCVHNRIIITDVAVAILLL